MPGSFQLDAEGVTVTGTKLGSQSWRDSEPLDPSQLGLDPLDIASGPKRLNHYVVLAKLGHGGMGVVYAAYDETLDRKVAIKLLRTHASPNTQLRLIREAKAMARLSHPNVVRIYESGSLDDQTYVVMEFVEGVTLREWLDLESRSRAEILDVFIAAGRGLAAAHVKNLIHRDFKPDNVMLASDGRVLVMDFGLARSGTDKALFEEETVFDPDDATELSSTLTAAGTLLGTPAYMAPEQIGGWGMDARSDQFSFCVALWEALFERRPFKAKTLSKLLDVVEAADFDSPERSKVPGWLRRVLRRGLDADPNKRWPSMEVLLDVLERDPTRRRLGLLGGVALASVLGASAGLYLWSEPAIELHGSRGADELSACMVAAREVENDWNAEVQAELATAFSSTGLSYADTAWTRASRWLDDYALAWRAARAQACVSEALEPDLAHAEVVACLGTRLDSFAALTEAWSEADNQTVTLALTAAASLPPVARCDDAIWRAQRVAAPGDLGPSVANIRAHLERGAALRLAGRFEAARVVAEAALDQARALGWRPLEAEAELALGLVHDELGDYRNAAATLRRAYLAAIAGGHDLVALEAASGLALVVGDKLAHFDEGLAWAHVGLGFSERLQLDGSLYQADLLYGVGLIQDHQAAYTEALDSLRRSLTIAQATLGPDHPEVARQLNGLGGVHWSLGDYESARATQIRSLAIVEQVFGPDHPEVARSLTNLGLVLGRLGRHDEALAVQRRALEIREQALGPQHPDLATTLNAVGASLLFAGDHAAALEHHERALAIMLAELGDEHLSLARTLASIADAQLALGEPDLALASLERGLRIVERNVGLDHIEAGLLDVQRGRVLVALGRRAEGRTVLAQGHARLLDAFGADDPRVERAALDLDALVQ